MTITSVVLTESVILTEHANAKPGIKDNLVMNVRKIIIFNKSIKLSTLHHII